MHNENIYKYSFTFLYQSIAIYATTLAAYIVVRGFLIEKEFEGIFRDPVLYLLSAIIILSALAIIYNVYLRRRIIVTNDTITFRSALRELVIDRMNVSSIRRSVMRDKGLLKTPIISFRLKDRKRPIRIRTYNFERSEELYLSIKNWAGNLLDERRRLSRKGGVPE